MTSFNASTRLSKLCKTSFDASMRLFMLCQKEYTDEVDREVRLLLKHADPLLNIKGTTPLGVARACVNPKIETMMVLDLATSGRCGFCGESCLLSLWLCFD
jgi:hypothetical protein